METLAFLGLIALPLLASPIIYLAGRLYCRFLRPQNPCLAGQWLSLGVLLVDWGLFGLSWSHFQTQGPVIFHYGWIQLRMDGMGLLLAAVALTLGTLVTLYSGPYMAHEEHEEKYYASLTTMIGAMIGLGFAIDLFNLWLWFETMAISSYLLVAFYRQEAAALEAGIKYMFQSAAGSALVLLGIAIVFARTGTLNLQQIRLVEPSPHLLAAGALFVIGFGVKAALVPLHTWLPDAHSQAPSGISAMLSGVVIEAGLVAMLRTLTALTAVTASWSTLLLLFGALNMLLGNLLALRQTQIKRLLAFSSLSHVGYMLLGLGIAFYSGDADGATGSLFHLVNHGLMKGLAFLAAGALLYSLYLASGRHGSLQIQDLAGAWQRYPLATLTLSIALLGLGGLPPLAGFMSKWQIFLAGIHTNNSLIIGLVIFAALNSVLSLGYYAPLVNVMYRQQPSSVIAQGAGVPLAMQIPLLLLAAAVVAIGFWPGLMDWLTIPAGQSLISTILGAVGG